MREVIFKNLTSFEHRKKDIFLKEVFEKDGVVARTERRCFYFIKDIKELAKEEDLKKWLDAKNMSEHITDRHFHILKQHNDAVGADKLICKIAGTFYAVGNKRIYTIAFLHSFKISLAKEDIANH